MNLVKQQTNDSRNLTRRLPLAIVVTLVLQAAAALVWAGSAIERISQLESQQAELSDLHERTARLEEKITSVQKSLYRIENKLDRSDMFPPQFNETQP